MWIGFEPEVEDNRYSFYSPRRLCRSGPEICRAGTARRRLAHGPLSDRLSGARTVRASAHQTAARQTCSGLSSQDFDNLLGSTAVEFFDLTGGL
jgi:hypothetical protein